MSKLFSDMSLGAIRLTNRIVMPAMGTFLANEDGTVSERMIAYYNRRAKGGPGLIIVENCCTDPMHGFGPRALRISDDSYIVGLASLARTIKAHGVSTAIQLVHPGLLAQFGHIRPVAPSAIAQAEELSQQQIDLIVDGFAAGASRAREAGFDSVEIHGAHGALICQFLSPLFNKRTDRYGGDTYGRARLALEIVDRVRKEVGRECPIIFRISGNEHLDGGLTLNETIPIAKLLAEAGIDVLSVSAGSHLGSSEWVMQPMLLPLGCLVPLAAEMKQAVNIPIMVAGRINHPEIAENILMQGKADLIAMGRGLIADPDLPQKAKEGRLTEIRRCLACNTCGDVHPIVCLVNPEAGKELEVETKAEKTKKVLVLGTGAEAIEAARVARIRGHEVLFSTGNNRQSEHWSWLIKPFVKEKMASLTKSGVQVNQAESDIAMLIEKYKPDALIMTMGSVPIVPQIPGINQENVFMADDVLSSTIKVEREVAIIGGGNIGCEVAEFLHRRGVKSVIIVENGLDLGHGLEPFTRNLLRHNFAKYGVKILTNVEVIRIQDRKIVYRDKFGVVHHLQADSVIIALGSRADDQIRHMFNDRDFEIFPLNPCEQPREVYKAMQQSAAVARKI